MKDNDFYLIMAGIMLILYNQAVDWNKYLSLFGCFVCSVGYVVSRFTIRRKK